MPHNHQPPTDQPICLQGQLLLAAPHLNDGTFNRAVIFLTEHSIDKGAIGIILNHPTNATVGNLVPDPKLAPLHHIPVFNGGPLSTDQLSFSSISLNQQKGISFSPRISAKDALNLIKKQTNQIKASVGYAGWAPNQLENELLQNTWITAKVTPSLINHPHNLSLWNHLLNSISPFHSLIATAPPNPSLN